MQKKDDESNFSQFDKKDESTKNPSELLTELIRMGFVKPNITRSDMFRALELIRNFLNKK